MEEKHYQKIFDLGKQYLLSFEKVNEDILNKHLELGEKQKTKTLYSLYRTLLESLQNRQGMPNTIGDIDDLNYVLFNFDPKKVIKEYGNAWQKLFKRINSECNPKSQMNIKKKNSYWAIFCRGAISSAKFLSRFTSFDQFNEFINHFYFNEFTRAALPMLIAKEVDGLGFALACDFLKESGYTEFVKPDTHIKTIFKGLGISNPESKDYKVFKDVIQFSKIINQTPYAVDKLFWLIGSGDFYLDGIEVKTKRSGFIKMCKNMLKF